MDDGQSERLRKLLERLGTAIHASLADSDEVSRCLAELRGDGWGAVMVLEATLLCRHDENTDPIQGELRIHVGGNRTDAEYRIGSEDARWLTSIGVSPTRHRSHPQRPLPPLVQLFPPTREEG